MFKKTLLVTLLFIGTILNASPKSQSNVTELYIATFNRAPDNDGLKYWVDSSKLELEGVAESFFEQEETKIKYPNNISNGDFINYVYSNLFSRKPDKAGFDYWLDQLTNHSDVIHRSVFLLAIINGVKDNDSKILANKTIVGLSFANNGRDDLVEASEVMKIITADDSSVKNALDKYNIPKYVPDVPDIGGDGGEEIPPAPKNIDELLASTKSAIKKLQNYTPIQDFNYGKEFFVSTTGNDNNIGTIDSPFATLEKARDTVREYKKSHGIPSGGIVVWFRGGEYSLVKDSFLKDDFQKTRSYGIDFKAEDSGENGSPIAYRGYKNEKVRLIGAIPIKSSWFKSVDSSDPLWNRLDINARDHIKVANLKEHGIENLGQIGENHYALNTPLELFDDTTALDIARWPDREQSDKIPYYTDSKINIYGDNLLPNVAGSYTKETNIKSTDRYYTSFKKDTLVDGKQYYLRHFKPESDGVRRTWAIAEDGATKYPFEYSGTGYSIPRDFQTRNYPETTKGIPTTVRFEDIQFGFASYRKALSDKSFEYVGDRPNRWKNTGDLWVNGGFQYIWRNYHIKISTIDRANKTIHLAEKPGLGMKSIGKDLKRQYYVYNVLEELTTAGEYFIDKDNSKIYYYPKRDLSSSKLYGSMVQYYLINFDGASFVEFHDMAIEMSRQDLVDFTSGSHNLLSHIKLRNNGRFATLFKKETSNCGVEYSEISGSGEGAISLDGGDYKTLTNGNNFVTNNNIIGDNRWKFSADAISIHGVGNILEHNDIHGYQQQAINFYSNNCYIRYNNIYDVLSYVEDEGAIYSSRSWTHRGNKVNYNFIHDIKNNYSQQIITGIYFGPTISEQEIRGNIFYNIDGKGILQAGGRDNIIENNLFVHIATPFMGMNLGITQYSTTSGNSFNMLEKALKYNFKSGIYASTYPKLAKFPTHWNDIIDTHWLLPEGNSFRNNAGSDNLRWALNGKIKSGTKDLEVYDHAEMTPINMSSEKFKDLPYGKIGIQF